MANPAEQKRVEALQFLRILDTETEAVYDDLAFLARELSGAPVALVSLVDESRLFFKARSGTGATGVPRAGTFCDASVETGLGPFVVEDSRLDERFRGFRLDGEEIRFYAGFPLWVRDLEGVERCVGNLVILGHDARPLSPREREGLLTLARQVSAHLQGRMTLREANDARAAFARGQAQVARSVSAQKSLVDTVIQNAPLLLWAVDTEGVFTFYDGKGRRALGITTEERIGKNILELYADRPEVSGNVRKALRGEHVRDQAYLRGVCLENTFAPQYDDDGKIAGVVGLSFDVTERRRAEDELRAGELRFRSVYESSVSGLFFWNDQAGVYDANEMFLKIVGYTRADLQAKRMDLNAMTPPEYARVDARIRELLKTHGNFEPFEKEFIRKDGTRVPVLISGSMLPPEAGGGGVGFITDITARKSAEKERETSLVKAKSALETSRVKTQFLANMSHEIRTPISGILGMARLVADTALSAEQKDYVDSIVNSADSLLSVVNDILDITKIEGGKLELEESDFNLRDLVQETELAMGILARQKKLAFKLEGLEGLPAGVRGDGGRLRQVFNNLLSNAIKFTEVGGITLRASSIAMDAPADRAQGGLAKVRFEVEDTGIGVPDAAMARMFQSFTQVDASTVRKFGGSGLGLAICKQLVERLGGEIGVASLVGKGSTFWFTVSLALTSDSTDAKPRKVIPNVADALGRVPLVLIVEDNPVNQKIAVKFLEKMGIRTELAENGREALARLENGAYDLVLMDCQMPEMDGYEATAFIRNGGVLKCRDIPIVAMTANAIKGDREKCLAAGMNDYISKPVDPSALARMLLKWLAAERSDVAA